MNEIVKRIEQLMLEKNIKAAELARTINISKSSFTYYLSGKGTPSAEIIGNIANAFNTTTDYLIFGIEKSLDDMEHEMIIELYDKLNDINKKKTILEMNHLYEIQNLDNKKN